MIGLGPHTMTTGDWAFVAALQFALVVATAFAIWLAVHATRPGGRR